MLSIFNEKGQLVRSLLRGSIVPEGKFQINWDGNNDMGKALSNGLYFYTIKGENGGETKGKMVLMR